MNDTKGPTLTVEDTHEELREWMDSGANSSESGFDPNVQVSDILAAQQKSDKLAAELFPSLQIPDDGIDDHVVPGNTPTIQ